MPMAGSLAAGPCLHRQAGCFGPGGAHIWQHDALVHAARWGTELGGMTLDLTARLFDDADRAPLDPMELFEQWFAEAVASEINDPNAMAVATVDASGMPDVRMILMNGRDERGIVFFTNIESAKGVQLQGQPRAALLFHWKSVRRQVRIRGEVERVTAAEADAYFATRPRQSQVGAHASAQSRPVASRAQLLERVAELDASFGAGPVPRPEYWVGTRVKPDVYEFWQDGEYRLHNRMQFTRDGRAWVRRRLCP